MHQKLSILIIEDEIELCEEYKNKITQKDDLILIDTTNNTDTALNLIAEFLPDILILDLELHNGFGNGINLLQDLTKLSLKQKPFILVVTNNISSVTHKIVRELGADFLITKNQKDYSVDMVLNFIASISHTAFAHNNSYSSDAEAVQSYEQSVKNKINTELDLIGISSKLKGRIYLSDAIEVICKNRIPNISTVIAKKYSKTEASVERAMQTAINHAWKNTDIETLENHYTAYINPRKGVPTITEFICYYADKVK
ncbi:MAG: sporulation initiation factor Spo0A C-terminal domain-containing protein [Acutalibacteraceae bacterium]|nr:sporulation initiation factor Spo0A C-terminal domain-containing protein [Acutalibacteraceae bacterium]